MAVSEITAKHVSDLRKATGAGMMDAKRALEEAAGDMERAKELLREKESALKLEYDIPAGYGGVSVTRRFPKQVQADALRRAQVTAPDAAR